MGRHNSKYQRIMHSPGHSRSSSGSRSVHPTSDSDESGGESPDEELIQLEADVFQGYSSDPPSRVTSKAGAGIAATQISLKNYNSTETSAPIAPMTNAGAPIKVITASQPWLPYEETIAEFPFFAWMLNWRGEDKSGESLFPSKLRSFFFFRASLRYPLQKRLLWSITVGEIFIIPIILGLIILTCYTSWANVSGSGSPPSILLGFTIVTATHNSILTFLVGIPFERAMRYHKPLGVLTVIASVYHGYVAYYFQQVKEGDDIECPKHFPEKPCVDFPGTGQYLTGFVLTIAMASMVVFAFGPIRRFLFNMFYSIHILGFLVALGAGILHGGFAGFGVALWIFDIIGRYILMSHYYNPTSAQMTAHDDDIVSLTMEKPKGFTYKGGQYVFLCVPSVSLFEWHPFSISSSPHQDKLVLHVRQLGNWTKKLREHSETNGSSHIRVLIEGPYGAPEIDLDGDRYSNYLIVSGGIGVTPMLSIANELIYQSNERNRKLQMLHFVWAIRTPSFVETFRSENEFDSLTHSVLRIDNNKTADAGRIIRDIYVTDSVGLDEGSPIKFEKGRPNLKKIVQRACEAFEEDSESEGRLAVLFCGPSQMGDALVSACSKHKNVDVHLESFDL